MSPTKHLPNGTYPYNHNYNNHNNRNSTSTSSFTTSISTNSLTSKLDTNINHHSTNNNTTTNNNNNTLTRHPTLTSLTRWVSRKMSRPRLRNHAGELNEGRSVSEDEEDGRTTEDDYAAWCWAFSEGRTGGTYSHGYEYDHEYGYASYGEHGPGPGPVHGQKKYDENLLFSDFNEQNPPNGGPHSRKYEAHGHDHTYADHGGEQGTTKNTRGTYTFLQNPNDRLGRYESSDSVPADQLVRFTPIGHYGYSPLTAGRPVSPPRRILTPARYAETNRMEREKSDELKQKQRGFWGPVRALWVSLRRSR